MNTLKMPSERRKRFSVPKSFFRKFDIKILKYTKKLINEIMLKSGVCDKIS